MLFRYLVIKNNKIIKCRGVPWGAVGCHGVPWGAMGCRGVPWGAVGCHGVISSTQSLCPLTADAAYDCICERL